jgi:thioredoxin reductase
MPELAQLFDAQRTRDPTGTLQLRKSFRATAKLQLRQLRAAMRVAVNDHNILGDQYQPPDVRLRAFASWLAGSSEQVLLSTQWARPFILKAWRKGERDAKHETGHPAGIDSSEAVIALAGVEITGIINVMVQQVSREAARVIARKARRAAALRQLFVTFDKVAQNRLVVMCDVLAIKAYNEAKLNTYQAAGVRRVGIHAESLPHQHRFHADSVPLDDAEGLLPAIETIVGVIKTLEGIEKIVAEEEELVGILTAGDDRVCQLCEDYAEDAPYEIEEVRDVYPLHPRCRCAVYPWEDLRYKGDSIEDFDPSQPRDPAGTSTGGQWTRGGGGSGYEFVSPNIGQGGLSEAAKELSGPRQKALQRASQEVDTAFGIKGLRHDAIGAWSDGAENTIVTVVDGNENWDKLRVSAAIKGHLADQKAVLVFKEGEGKAALYRMHVPENDAQKLHENLIKDGLAFHTIMPHTAGGGADVIVADIDGSAHDAMAKAAERYNADVIYERGQAEFIGTTKENGTDREQRDDARRAYEEVIGQSPVQGSQEIWARLRNSWGETLGVTPEETSAPGRRLTSNSIIKEAPVIKPNSRSVAEVALSLHERAQDILEKEVGVRSITRENATPDLEAYVARTLAFELRDGLTNGHSAETWYNDKMKRTIEIAAKIHPEIATDKGKRFALTVALSIASQGEKVERAARIAEEVYTRFNETGQFPTDIKVADPSITGNFKKMNKLIERLGIDQTEKLFNTEFTNRELKAATGFVVGKTTMDDKVYGSAVLGPKIGQGFYQNLNGNFSPITMDMWFMRSWGRLTGTGIGYTDMNEQREKFRSALMNEGVKNPPEDMDALHELSLKMVKAHEKDYQATRREKTPAEHAAERFDYNYGGAMVEAPKGGQDRIWITSVFDKALAILDKEGTHLTRAAAQATWWTPEQTLYKKLGVRVIQTSSDYAAAYEKIAKEKGVMVDADQQLKLEFAPWIDDPDPYDEMTEEQMDQMVEGFAYLQHKHDAVQLSFDYDPNEPRVPKGSGEESGRWTTGSGGGGAGKYGLVPGDVEKFHALKNEWSKVNNDLLEHVDNPDGPESRAALDKLETIVKQMHGLHADPGGAAGIGLPGGPRDVVIVGAGPGGLAASINGAAEGLDTLVVEANAVAGGQAKYSSRIENFPGFPIGVTGERLTQNMFTQAGRLGAETKLGIRVEGMTYDPDTGLKHLTLSNGEQIDSRTVILAGGVEFRKLDFPGSDGPRVVVGDGKALIKEAAGGPVVVVGGSNGAAQAALGCAQKSERVYLLARSPIGLSMSDYQVTALRNNPKITVIESDSIAKLNRDEQGNPVSVETAKGERLQVSAVGAFVGSMPNTKWLPASIPLAGGKIATNADYETPVPGVYAVGDMRSGGAGRVGVAVGEGQFALRQANAFLDTQRHKTDAVFDARTPDTSWITHLFALDRDNPWFGQTVEDVTPPKKKVA